jgi:hypothetical protein
MVSSLNGFRKEIVDQFPSFGGITYKDAVSLVGAANIDATLIERSLEPTAILWVRPRQR